MSKVYTLVALDYNSTNGQDDIFVEVVGVFHTKLEADEATKEHIKTCKWTTFPLTYTIEEFDI